MGLEDREWFQEGRRERERLIAADKDRARNARHARSPLTELLDTHDRKNRGGIRTFAKALGLLVVLCLAVVGALALVKHFAG